MHPTIMFPSTELLEVDSASRHLHVCLLVHHIVKMERPDLKDCILNPLQEKLVTAVVLAHSMVECERIYSVFHRNINKALLQITGSSEHFTMEAMTMFGSFIDAEVVFDSNGKPLSIPPQWKSWKQPMKLLEAAYKKEDNQLRDRVNSLLSRQKDVTLSDDTISLASDWEGRLGATEEPIAKRVVIEADGPWHYASNCNQKLGKTVLKHRLLKAYGWDLIAVSQNVFAAMKMLHPQNFVSER